MKSISPTVYENLTPRQRVAATVEAVARDDQQEVQRLVRTCPKKTYFQHDADYTDTMRRLLSMALVVECDLRGMALTCTSTRRNNPSLFQSLLQEMSDLYAAWQEILKDYGIATDIMDRAIPLRHIWLVHMLKIAPPPIPGNVQHIRETMKDSWDQE